jgi:hypothetical protein
MRSGGSVPRVGILASPTVGRDSIYESLRTTFGGLYADVRTSVHHVLVDGDMGTARFTMHARALIADGRPYQNECCVCPNKERVSHPRVGVRGRRPRCRPVRTADARVAPRIDWPGADEVLAPVCICLAGACGVAVAEL